MPLHSVSIQIPQFVIFMTVFQRNIIVMRFVFADEIGCKMTTIIEDNSQSDLGPADGPVNVHLAAAAAVTALHPAGQRL